jgi:uncharacterized protein
VKYLLWVLVIYLAWRWYTAFSKAPPKSAGQESAPTRSTGADGATETMVKCAHCGIYLPQSEAIHGPDAITFCNEDHRALHRHR